MTEETNKPALAIKKPQVTIYTDGACKGNPGPGGWGAWLRFRGHEKELWGGERLTTNNRMELTAVIEDADDRSRQLLYTAFALGCGLIVVTSVAVILTALVLRRLRRPVRP